MTEYDYIEALGGGSFLNMPCTMNQNMEVEFKFMTTGYPDHTYQRQGGFFVLGGNGGDDWVVSDYWTLNEEHTATWTKDVWTFDEHSHNTTGGCYTGSQNLSITCLDCGLRIVSVTVRLNGSVVNEFVGAEDNGVVGLYDKANNVFYQPTSGTWSTGTYDNFEASKYEVGFTHVGGTDTLTVSSDYAWTCNTPADFTLSPTSGTAGDTTVTVTAGHSGVDRTNTVTFTDTNSNTFDVVLKQSGDGSLFPFAKIIRGTRRIN